MDNSASQRVQDLLTKHDKIGVLVGKNPSLDQMAASLSLYLGIKSLGKNPGIASPTQPIVANSSLVGIDKVKNELSGEGGDLIVSFPYQEGEIEKVSYTLENGYLNIVVKATDEGLSFAQEDVIFKRSGGVPTLLFIVGTARLSDLGTLFDATAFKDTAVINIDNQADNQGFGDVVLVNPNASSVSELVGNILLSLQMQLDQDIAQNLLSGIADATNNFQNGNTTYLAFTLAGEFMQKGAKRVQQRDRQSDTKSPFGPFSMPNQRQFKDAGTKHQFQGQQQPRETRSVSDRPSRDGQRPWDRGQQKVQQSQQQANQAQDQSGQTAGFTRQPQPQQVPQPQMTQSQPMQKVEHKEEKDEAETPPDWLAPKVYKSSTLI